ncbi:hypothetical protein [Amycolatopsis sp. cg9]
MLNLSPVRCGWRALRRVLRTSGVDVVELRSPRAVAAFLSRAG